MALATVGTATTLAARQMLAASGNRTALLQASWRAEGCVAYALATLDGLLRAEQGRPGGVFERWRALDSTLAAVGLGTDAAVVTGPTPWPASTMWPGAPIRCIIRLDPAGGRADLNVLDLEELRTLFRAAGLPLDRADALAMTLDGWRRGEPVDTSARGPGAPVGGARVLTALQQLLDVPGFDSAAVAALAPAADVEPGRLYLRRAPEAALATLPGVGGEIVARVLERRRLGAPVSLIALTGDVSPAAARDVMSHLGTLAGRVTEDPDAWVLTATAVGTDPSSWAHDHQLVARAAPTATVEVRLARAGWRVAVMRRRSSW